MPPTRPHSILILEDEPIVALDLEQSFSDAGFDVAHVASNCSDALTWLDRNTPDAVVLDVELNDGPSVAVARHLVDRATPFLVFSGTKAGDGASDPVFLNGVWVEKPCPSGTVVAAIRAMTEPDRAPGTAARSAAASDPK